MGGRLGGSGTPGFQASRCFLAYIVLCPCRAVVSYGYWELKQSTDGTPEEEEERKGKRECVLANFCFQMQCLNHPPALPHRHGGKVGDALWSNTVDCNINCSREIRNRLGVKNGFTYVPSAVKAFHDH